MSKSYSSTTSDDHDEYPKVTQADLDRAKFCVGLESPPRKQRITISLDANLIEYFKSKAGERGYQTLINETLRQAKEREDLEGALHRVIRQEMLFFLDNLNKGDWPDRSKELIDHYINEERGSWD